MPVPVPAAFAPRSVSSKSQKAARAKALSGNAHRLFDLLASYARAGIAWPSRVRMADDLGCTVRSIDNWKRELFGAGLADLARQGGKHRGTNRYRLRTLPCGFQEERPFALVFGSSASSIRIDPPTRARQPRTERRRAPADGCLAQRVARPLTEAERAEVEWLTDGVPAPWSPIEPEPLPSPAAREPEAGTPDPTPETALRASVGGRRAPREARGTRRRRERRERPATRSLRLPTSVTPDLLDRVAPWAPELTLGECARQLADFFARGLRGTDEALRRSLQRTVVDKAAHPERYAVQAAIDERARELEAALDAERERLAAMTDDERRARDLADALGRYCRHVEVRMAARCMPMTVDAVQVFAESIGWGHAWAGLVVDAERIAGDRKVSR